MQNDKRTRKSIIFYLFLLVMLIAIALPAYAAVEMVEFRVFSLSDRVRLEWETAQEYNLIGFQLYCKEEAETDAEQFYFDLVEPDAMKERLNAVSMDNWVHCVDEALRKSGTRPDGQPYNRADLDFLNMVLIKPSGHREMLERLGLTEAQSVYLGEIGHTGEQDAMFGIREGVAQGRLKDGDLMAIVAAGIGYVWAAATVAWGEADSE